MFMILRLIIPLELGNECSIAWIRMSSGSMIHTESITTTTKGELIRTPPNKLNGKDRTQRLEVYFEVNQILYDGSLATCSPSTAGAV